MAEHRFVFRSVDRRWRISADVNGKRFTVERDGMLSGRFNSLPALQQYLRQHGIDFADLVQD